MERYPNALAALHELRLLLLEIKAQSLKAQWLRNSLYGLAPSCGAVRRISVRSQEDRILDMIELEDGLAMKRRWFCHLAKQMRTTLARAVDRDAARLLWLMHVRGLSENAARKALALDPAAFAETLKRGLKQLESALARRGRLRCP